MNISKLLTIFTLLYFNYSTCLAVNSKEITIEHIIIDGNDVIPQNEISQVIDSNLEGKITEDKLSILAKNITKLYKSNGYKYSYATYLKDELKNKILVIKIHEPIIQNISYNLSSNNNEKIINFINNQQVLGKIANIKVLDNIVKELEQEFNSGFSYKITSKKSTLNICFEEKYQEQPIEKIQKISNDYKAEYNEHKPISTNTHLGLNNKLSYVEEKIINKYKIKNNESKIKSKISNDKNKKVKFDINFWKIMNNELQKNKPKKVNSGLKDDKNKNLFLFQSKINF